MPTGRSSGHGPRLGVALLAGVAGVGLSWRIADGGSLLSQRWGLLVLVGAWWAVFAVGVAAVLRLPPRLALPLVVVLGLAMRLVALAGPPVMSDDLYRYAWDGRVQEAGIDPYRYRPSAPELVGLRDPWLWPDDATCAALDRRPRCTRINRAGVRTIYPPVAQVWFRAVSGVLPSGSREGGWQAAALVVDIALVGMVLVTLRAFGRDPRAVVLYAWSPIAVLETAQAGHVEGLAVIAVIAALWAARRGRAATSGALIGAAALVKLYPALLLPVLVCLPRRRRPGTEEADRAWRRWEQPARVVAGFTAVVVLGYAPHVAELGGKVLGYLPGYLAEERYGDGSRFLLVGLFGLPALATQAVVAAGLVVAGWLALRSRQALDIVARNLLGVVFLLITPVQPWYALVLVAVAALGSAWWWLVVAAAGYPVYMATILGDVSTVAVGRLSYGLAALVVAGAALRRGRSARGSGTRNGCPDDRYGGQNGLDPAADASPALPDHE